MFFAGNILKNTLHVDYRERAIRNRLIRKVGTYDNLSKADITVMTRNVNLNTFISAKMRLYVIHLSKRKIILGRSCYCCCDVNSIFRFFLNFSEGLLSLSLSLSLSLAMANLINLIATKSIAKDNLSKNLTLPKTWKI